MLTTNQEKYLQKIPENRRVSIKPFDQKASNVAAVIEAEMKKTMPELEVLFMGAAALGIAGQNDLDLYILCPEKDFGKYLPKLEEHFGKRVQGISIIKWEFTRNVFPVELYLTDPNTSSMKEQIKLNSDGIPFREYMKRKYEFFNKVLGEA